MAGRQQEATMNGYQLTFYTEQNRKHGNQTVCEWLLHEAHELGIRGATVIQCAQGVGHAGDRHAAHALRLADQPQQIILATTDDEANRLLDIVRAANVHLFYVRAPVEFGWLGVDESPESRKHFHFFRRSDS
jgi:PII-like signaling protein